MVKFSHGINKLKIAVSSHRDLKEFDRGMDREELELVKSLMNEFHSVAVLVATTSSIVAAVRSGADVRLHGAINSYLPTDPLIFPAVVAGLFPRTLEPELIFNLQEFYIRAKFASNVTAHWPLAPKAIPDNTKADLRELSDLWGRVCGLAMTITYHVDGLDLGHELLQWRLREVRETLRLARDGSHPCVASDGTVVVPGWLERRRESRVRVERPIWIEADGIRQQSTLKDVSVHGMGIASCRGVTAGMPIVAQLEDGRRLRGIAVWVGPDDRIGVRMLQPLAASDPLLNLRQPWISIT